MSDVGKNASLFQQISNAVHAGSQKTPMEISDAERALATYVDPTTGKMVNASMEQQQSGDESADNAPVQDGLMENYPNPFNPTTVISYQLSVNGHVTLKVYDVLGREVKTLVNESQNVGIHSATFDASRLASGVYFYRLTAPGINQVKKMLLTK